MGPAYGRRRETQPHSFLLPCFFSFFFSFLSFSLVYPRPFPWSIKGKARLPIQGPNPTKPEQKSFYRTSPLESNTLTHPHSHTSETWGPAPVLSVCNPYYKHSVLVTRATTVNWTQRRSARTSINLVSSQHTIRAGRAIQKFTSR